ncbi:hypothetical protein [Sphingomonas sp. BK345]|nr:hypothetical protein [Sphingomonas sp. BK345]MBB3473886.1 hypothetical protein [Sphingomonas sp. BK345]
MERRTMLGFSLATLVGSTSLGEPAGAATPASAGAVRAAVTMTVGRTGSV